MTRKETALDALNKKIPKLEEKINQDKQLLEELKAKREMLEVEALKCRSCICRRNNGNYRNGRQFFCCKHGTR